MPLDLIRQIRAFYAERGAAHHEASAHVPAIVAGLERCAEPHLPVPASLAPVERHLDEALGLGRGRGHDALIDAIAEARDALVWYSCESAYGDSPDHRHFFDNYAFAILVGPGRHGFESLYRDQHMLCGLTIQAPGVHYPAHAHPAVEVYGVLGGTARWRRGEEAWSERPPGSIILHESGVAHAMETADEPTRALFTWVRNLGHPPTMVEA